MRVYEAVIRKMRKGRPWIERERRISFKADSEAQAQTIAQRECADGEWVHVVG